MAKETETVEETVEKKVTYYVCDKCHGRFHDKTEYEEDLNRVVFGASAILSYTVPDNTFNAHNPSTNTSEAKIVGEHEYLLCDRCMERAHEYLRDFF